MLQRFEDFVIGITSCYKCIQKIRSYEMTEFGLKGAHAMCIYFLAHNPDGLTASQLCQLCSEDKAAISRNLNTLYQKGYIAENSGSKYRAVLRLTESGMKLAEKIDVMIADWVERGSMGLTEEERLSFYKSLEQVSNNLKNNFGKKKRSQPAPAE